MELQTGICGICSSNSSILNSEYSESYCNLIYSHFEKELNISNESKTNFDLCPTCVYQITLINSKKSLLFKENEDEAEVGVKCALCKQSGEIFKIADISFLNKCKSWMPIKDMVSLCASCFYIIEVHNSLKVHVMQKLFLKDDNSDQKSPPKLRTILKRKKSTFEVDESSAKESNQTNSGIITLECNKRKLDLLDSTPVKSKIRRRSKNLGELLDKESNSLELKNSKEVKKIIGQSENQLFDLSSISEFSPLCKTDFHIDKKYRLDEKMYNCIPYVKIHNFEQTTIQKNDGNYVCSLISQRPMIRVRRTPPIKIKTIKEVKNGKKNAPEKRQMKSISKISQQKLVVKVERMKLDIKDETTPKKKKRVHFNDTPTIIIPEDDYYDDYRNKRNNRKLQEKKDTENVEIIDDVMNVEEEKSDSEELITLSLEESDDELKKKDPIEIEKTEENTGEMENDTQTSEETTSKDNRKDSSEDEEKNGEAKDLREGETCFSKKRTENDQDLNDSSDDCVIEEDGRVVDEKTEDDCVIVDCEGNSKITLSVDKKTEETAGDKKDSSDECVLVECEDTSENDKIIVKKSTVDKEDGLDEYQVDCDDGCVIESEDTSENDKIVDKKNEDSDKDGKDEISTQEEFNHKSVEKTCTNLINDPQEKEESIKPSNEKTCLKERPDFEDEKSEHGTIKDDNIEIKNLKDNGISDEKTVENKTEDEPATEICPDKNVQKENEDTEKDSLDGFEVLDQDDGDLIMESNEKVSSDKDEKSTEDKESTDNMEEIELLVKKYCQDKEADKEVSEEKDEVNAVDNDAQSAPEKNISQEEREKTSGKQNSEEDNEGFGPLIDEVQKCLTSTTDVLDRTEAEDLVPNSLELEEILNISFEEESKNTANFSSSNNGNTSFKRKNFEDEVSENKREKIDNSSI